MALVDKKMLCQKEQARTFRKFLGIPLLIEEASRHPTARPDSIAPAKHSQLLKQLVHKPYEFILSAKVLAQKVEANPSVINRQKTSTPFEEARRRGSE